MKEFDYVIIGGGCAGLSLAYELEIHNKLENKTLAIIEPRLEYKKDKTWSFWKVANHNFNDCVKKNWEKLKLQNSDKGLLDGVPNNLPTLIRATRVQEKVASVGFDFKDTAESIKKVFEEYDEFNEALVKKDKSDNDKPAEQREADLPGAIKGTSSARLSKKPVFSKILCPPIGESKDRALGCALVYLDAGSIAEFKVMMSNRS